MSILIELGKEKYEKEEKNVKECFLKSEIENYERKYCK